MRAAPNRVAATVLIAIFLQSSTHAFSNTPEHRVKVVQDYQRPVPKSFGDRHIVRCVNSALDATTLLDCLRESSSRCDVINVQDAVYCSREISDFLDAYLGFLIAEKRVKSRFTASTYRKWSVWLSNKCDKIAETLDTHGVEQASCEIDARMTVIHKYAPAGAIYEPCRLSRSCR